MTTSIWTKNKIYQNPDIKTDVLIVGAGYVGLSSAYWLKQYRPDLKITVLDRGLVGSGASGRNAGFLTKGSAFFYHHLMQRFNLQKALEIFSFAQRSLELVSSHLLESASDIQFEQTTSLTLVKNPDFIKNLDLFKNELAKCAFNWLEPSYLSPLLKNKFLGGFESLNEFKINPIQLLHALRKELQRRSVNIIDEMTAYRLEENIVFTDSLKIHAENIVFALNGYSGRFLNEWSNFIKPYRAQMLAVELKHPLNCPSLYYDPEDRVYWRKSGENSLLIGGKRLLDEQNEQTDFDHLNGKIQTALEAYLRDTLGLNYNVLHRWSGIMGFTQSELPIVTKLKNNKSVHLIGGFSGHGMGFGFHAGKDLAEVLLNLKTKSFFQDFHEFDFL